MNERDTRGVLGGKPVISASVFRQYARRGLVESTGTLPTTPAVLRIEGICVRKKKIRHVMSMQAVVEECANQTPCWSKLSVPPYAHPHAKPFHDQSVLKTPCC
jgi:hypothetical protein